MFFIKSEVDFEKCVLIRNQVCVCGGIFVGVGVRGLVEGIKRVKSAKIKGYGS